MFVLFVTCLFLLIVYRRLLSLFVVVSVFFRDSLFSVICCFSKTVVCFLWFVFVSFRCQFFCCRSSSIVLPCCLLLLVVVVVVVMAVEFVGRASPLLTHFCLREMPPLLLFFPRIHENLTIFSGSVCSTSGIGSPSRAAKMRSAHHADT